MPEYEIINGDITKLSVDAIVNAANSSLLGGGGVDGAIHAAAGKELLKECKALNGCNTGEAKLTKGYNLPAKYIIHTVGPIWYGGNQDEYDFLTNCYINSLQIAIDNKFKSIAFPSISTGIYGYPIELASEIAISTVTSLLDNNSTVEKVIFVCFGSKDYEVYKRKFSKITSSV